MLALESLSLASVCSINLLLSSMSDFPLVNVVYKTFFGTSPPMRACVGVNLPAGARLCLEAIAFDGPESERRALHVQGLSYWAPANIGPYSQAVTVSLLLPPSLIPPRCSRRFAPPRIRSASASSSPARSASSHPLSPCPAHRPSPLRRPYRSSMSAPLSRACATARVGGSMPSTSSLASSGSQISGFI